MKQNSFADLAYDQKKKKTHKERFLNEINTILPWKHLLKPNKKRYPNSANDRPAIAPEIMLRIYFIQQCYGLSDPAMEDSLYDNKSMRRFAGISLDSVPAETMICKFRHFLENNNLTKK